MARLILLNGPPAIGKTTLARRYAAEHPGTLCLDIDEIRALVPDWRADPFSAGLLARGIAVAAAGRHLVHGSVVVPQFLARPEFIDRLTALAEESTVEFREIVLLDDRSALLRRFAQRSSAASEPGHRDAARQVTEAGGAAALGAMYDRLVALLATRPNATVIRSEAGAIDRTYRALLAALGQRPAG